MHACHGVLVDEVVGMSGLTSFLVRHGFLSSDVYTRLADPCSFRDSHVSASHLHARLLSIQMYSVISGFYKGSVDPD